MLLAGREADNAGFSNRIVTTTTVNYPPNKILRMDMDERKRFACWARNPPLLGKEIDYCLFPLLRAVSAFPYDRLASSSVVHK